MNLHKIANSAIRRVNPNIQAVLKKYAGETIGHGRKPAPSYLPDQNVTIQLQPISRGDMQHVDGLNIQGLAKVIYVNGNYFSVQREIEQWLVVEPVELWPDWCRLIAVLQVSP